MTAETMSIRAEAHEDLGAIIQRDTDEILRLWARRVVEETPDASRLHLATLLDHLPQLLRRLGQSLAESGAEHALQHHGVARQHGEHRWEIGWSLPEVVRDYQVLRLVLVQYLEEAQRRTLRSREHMAINLALDEAISFSVDGYVHEMTERARESDRAMSAQAEVLKAADRNKDEFLALLAHELRNPLAPVRNAVQVLALKGDDPDTVNWARALIDRQTNHMTRMVDDLLDLSRIAQGKLLLQTERLDMSRLVRDSVADLRPVIEAAGLQLELIVPEAPVWVSADPTRMTQIIGNLIHNAIKFTDRGGSIAVELDCDQSAHRARLSVCDTGVGLEASMLPRVFDTFTQADRSLDRSRKGLGLGLALVKGLVEFLGGEVKAASDGPGLGAQFTVWLPLAPDQEPAAFPSRIAASPSHSSHSGS